MYIPESPISVLDWVKTFVKKYWHLVQLKEHWQWVSTLSALFGTLCKTKRSSSDTMPILM